MSCIQEHDIACERRALALGDYLWVRRLPGAALEGGRDAVLLDVCIERKKVSDLNSSITDGRYKEQKWRLQKVHETYIGHLPPQDDTIMQRVQTIVLQPDHTYGAVSLLVSSYYPSLSMCLAAT